jgi:hypothetical protein
MTRHELSILLGLPSGDAAGDVLKAYAARLTDIGNQLAQEGLQRPVKIMLNRELGELESSATLALIQQLEQAGRVELLLADIDHEMAKPGWTHGLVELLRKKLEPLIPSITEDLERFQFEKRMVEIADKLKTAAPPPPPPPAPPPPPTQLVSGSTPGSMPPHDLPSRLESYFSEILAERSKSSPDRRVVQRWLQKITTLVEQLPDPAARIGYEKRVVEIECWTDGTQRPWPKPQPSLPIKPKLSSIPEVPPKPTPGTLLQFLPKAADGTLRRSGAPIHFVARPRFVLGRLREKLVLGRLVTVSDLVTKFLPADSTANQLRNTTISRWNTTLFVKGNQVWIHDGGFDSEGNSTPSTGTVVDGQNISTTPLQLNFAKERNLKLGQSAYELSALHLPAVSPAGPLAGTNFADTASSQATVVLSSHPSGCLRFRGISCRDLEINAIWLFSEASLGADPTCAITLDGAGLPPIALRIHHWEKGFWLTVSGTGKSKILLDGQPLSGGDVRALQASHQLTLGILPFEVKVGA